MLGKGENEYAIAPLYLSISLSISFSLLPFSLLPFSLLLLLSLSSLSPPKVDGLC